MTADNSISILTISVAIIFTSCNSNAIYFDIENQSIKSCSKKGIRQIYINNDSSTETYFLLLDDAKGISPGIINLKKIDEEYKIYKGWKRTQIPINQFVLLPLSVYTLERAQGDASPFKIKIWTDKVGNINKTTNSRCDNWILSFLQLWLDSTLTIEKNKVIYGDLKGFNFSEQFEMPISVTNKFENEIERIRKSKWKAGTKLIKQYPFENLQSPYYI